MHRFKAYAPTIFLLVLALWLWWPIAGAVQVEGFGAMIVSLAKGMRTATLGLVDTAYPFDAEFYFLTRLGIVAAIAFFPIDGLDGSTTFAWITSLSFLVSAFAISQFVRQWTTASPVAILLAVIILPGFADSAFFLHENLLGLAFFSASLVLLGANQGALGVVGSGVLLGLAMLTRIDFLLVAPALPLVLWLRLGAARRLMLSVLAGGLATAVTFLAPLFAFGVTPLDIMVVVTRSVELWSKQPRFEVPLREGLLFAGAPGLVLILLGTVSTFARAEWRVRLLLLGVPVFFLAIYGTKLWQARQFLPILPFLAALTAVGACTLWRLLPSKTGRTAACLVLAFVWLWPGAIVFSDGPRSIAGLLWKPLVWNDWQKQVKTQMGVITAEIAHLGNGSVVLTDDWSVDRFTHLAFRDQGWLPEQATLCSKNVEVWRKADKIAYHVRLHLPFISYPDLALQPLLEQFVSDCLPVLATPALRRLSVGAWTASRQLPSFLNAPAYWTVVATTINREDVNNLMTYYSTLANDEALTSQEVAEEAMRLQATTMLMN